MAVASLVALLLVAFASPARAAVERFAVLIASNQGAGDEQELRFAESDAAKLRDVLVDLGGFRAENVTLLSGASAGDVRTAIITVNDRIRTLPAGNEAVLVVYYSGHADASALHLGRSSLALPELERLVRGSAAMVRLLVLDACRSGAVTRVKGGRRVAAFAIDLDERLASEGAVFLTSSAANEDAQESDELRGSFFTHYLVSGLLGAADESGDDQVSLHEAYRYAYENTLRASSRTLGGSQHPTFRFNLAGKGDLVLTRLAGGDARRAWLSFPPDRSYLVMEGGPDGAVVGEVGARDRRRRLSVRPGRYFVRGRGATFLLEGTVTAAGGSEQRIADDQLERIAYARLVRKGGGHVGMLHGPQLGARARTALANSRSRCVGAFAGYLIETESLDIGVRAGWCRAGYENFAVTTVIDEFDLALVMRKVWDVGPLWLGPQIDLGGGAFEQRFTLGRSSPSRRSAMGHAGVGLAVGAELGGGLVLSLASIAESFVFRQRDELDRLATSAGFRLEVGLGWRL
jgi:hypothetical protein